MPTTTPLRFLLLACLSSAATGFTAAPHHSRAVAAAASSALRLQAESSKGFGSQTKKAKAAAAASAAAAAKPKNAATVARSDAANTLDEQVKAGTPEYAVFARPFGGDGKDWKSVGSIACPRTEKPDDVIFKNEEALVSGLFKLYPAMKKEGMENFEYGFRSKKFPDDDIRLAFKRTGKSENPIMNWFGSLSNPVNTDNY